jgi:hypothetical protein
VSGRAIPSSASRHRGQGSISGEVTWYLLLGKVSSECFGFTGQFSFHRLYHNHLPTRADHLPGRPILTPTYETKIICIYHKFKLLLCLIQDFLIIQMLVCTHLPLFSGLPKSVTSGLCSPVLLLTIHLQKFSFSHFCCLLLTYEWLVPESPLKIVAYGNSMPDIWENVVQ